VLHQFRCRTRDDNSGTFRSLLDARDDYAHALPDGKRLQPRLLLAGSFGFGLADIENYIRALDPLHGGVHNLADATDVLVEHRVPFGFAHLLEDDLFCQLSGDATQNAFRLFRDMQFSTDFDVGIDLARVLDCHLQSRIFDLLGRLYHAFYRKCANLSRVFIEMGAQVFLSLVILARGDDDRIFYRADHNLRINALFSAKSVNCVVELACHNSVLSRWFPVFSCCDALLATSTSFLSKLRHQIGLLHVGQLEFQLLRRVLRRTMLAPSPGQV
jgi:hypothetical protein